MATPKSQRIGIWIIAIVMIVGTLGSFAVMVLTSKNGTADQARIQKLSAQYQTDYQAYQKKLEAQTKELSDKYYSQFKDYESKPAKFDKSEVKSLNKTDIKIGTGSKLTQKSTFTTYYIGWTPNGKVFDGSFDGKKLKAPFKVTPGGVISGWTEGADGMKVGGIRELTIPSGKAYGEAGSGDKIPANTPLKFILMVIPTPSEIKEPAVPQELLEYYQQNSAQ
jgi:FKBP-type peptidyl-prolyl cis-trans isomerase FkpA